MKSTIHPTWNPQAAITCVCGNTFTAGSTLPSIKVEICAACHPFYTGTQKLVDTQGQVEKFTKFTEQAKEKKAEREKIVAQRAEKVQKTSSDKPSLKDLLMQARKQTNS